MDWYIFIGWVIIGSVPASLIYAMLPPRKRQQDTCCWGCTEDGAVGGERCTVLR